MEHLINYKLFDSYKFGTTQNDEYITLTVYDGENKIGSFMFHDQVADEEDWKFQDEIKYAGKLDYYILIDEVTIDEYYQKSGIGTTLMKKGMALVKRKFPFIKTIVLNASPTGIRKIPLPKLVEFYQKFGFKILSPEGNNVIMIKTTP